MAFPYDALEPNDLKHAHPFAQLVNYLNLRILMTRSQWNIPLCDSITPKRRNNLPTRFLRWPQPARGTPSPRSEASDQATRPGGRSTGSCPALKSKWPPGFRYSGVIAHSGQRLVVADLTPLHAAYRQEDLDRPQGQLPPFGRPEKRFSKYSGYHTDIYSKEVYQLIIGFSYAQRRLGSVDPTVDG